MKRIPWLAWVSAGVLMFLYLPMILLVIFSFNASKYGASWEGFTLSWYTRLFERQDIMRSSWNSLIVASFSSVLATWLGTMAAMSLERFRWKRKGWCEGFLYLPLVVPELMMAVGLLLFFSMVRLPLGRTTLVLSHTAFNLPIVWMIVAARLKKLDPRLEEAAVDLGATPWMAFRHVTFPLLLPAILGGLLMSFVISLDDFVISFFMSGPESSTLPVQIYSMLRFAITPEVHALSSLLMMASMILVVIAWFFQEEMA